MVDKNLKASYSALRAERPEIPARIVFAYLNGEYDPIAQNIDQAVCSHKFCIDEESDRCYCYLCGIDGDA